MIVGPVMVKAQVAPPAPGQVNECCIIRHAIGKIPPDAANIAAGAVVAPSMGATCDMTVTVATPNWAAYCTLDTVMTISDWIFWIAFVLAGIVIVYGGIMFMTAAGDPEKAGKAKKVLAYGIIGIVVAIVAKFIPGIAKFFIGM